MNPQWTILMNPSITSKALCYDVNFRKYFFLSHYIHHPLCPYSPLGPPLPAPKTPAVDPQAGCEFFFILQFLIKSQIVQKVQK